MVDIVQFKTQIKKKQIDKNYIFCGYDEQLMKESIDILKKDCIDNDFRDFNINEFDGNSLDNLEAIINTCETLPFMSKKRMIIIYRCNFLDESNKSAQANNIYKEFKKYLEKTPEHCIIVAYFVFNSKRDKIGRKITALGKIATVVEADRLKNSQLIKKVESLFKSKDIAIGKTELVFFCAKILGKELETVENEIEKLISYTFGRDIKKEDIELMFQKSSDDDIFDLTNSISQKKPVEALDVLNTLYLKGEKGNIILSMIERQLRLLLLIKNGMDEGKGKDEIAKDLSINPYRCSIIIKQCSKFNKGQLLRAVDLCLTAEKNLKSTSRNGKNELEFLIVDMMA
jgi:DNA polymerase III subunit delta